uniref:MarR family transcriptional regulator n=1 Tax=Neorhizobium sp. EC2-8 TaxID=3129230 RepID=UPI00310131E1
MKHHERLTEADYEALANLRYSIRRFRKFSASEADKLGLQPQQHQALLAIKGLSRGEQMTARLLSERLLIARHSAEELLQQLIDEGYVDAGTPTSGHTKDVIHLARRAEDALDLLASAHLFEIRKMAPELMQALRVLQDREKMQSIAWMI